MTGNPASVSVLALAGCLAYLGMFATQGFVRAQTTFVSGSESDPLLDAQPLSPAVALFDFDLPSQALGLALDQFAVVSGRSALFRTELVTGRMSSAVKGRYAPIAALRLLLSGSGLEVEEVSAGKIVALVLKPLIASNPAFDEPSVQGAVSSYDTLIQARVWEAICSDTRTASSEYRTLINFQIDQTGRIGHVRLLKTTGDGRRDAALLELLRNVILDSPPPLHLSQPFTMLILPEQRHGPTCTQRSSGYVR